MANSKPIFCATHPRACSTAFERVFMTRKDLTCVHEPFGDAFYYGPERVGSRYEKDEEARKATGFTNSTYKTIFDRLDREGADGRRLFIKDMICYLVPPDSQPPKIAPSLHTKKRGIGTSNDTNGVHYEGQPPFPFATYAEDGNPSIIPRELLEKFHFTFLIRDPHSSIPSYWRCTIPPLDDVTGFYEFYPNEAGYDELRRFFDFAKDTGLVGPKITGQQNGIQNGTNGETGKVDICLVDADDLLDDPESIIKQYSESVGLEYSPRMLNWDNDEDQKRAHDAFEKWKGFHDDALNSKDLKPRAHKKAKKTEAQWDAEWVEKYGEKGAKIIRETVDKNMPDYLYLKQFALKP
ncbi:hypothetical protein PV10_01367 [Exophiala mesophila]|uniref:Sulfotransferase domain-containing protein n=1 Tax=Exophiala mesophila TaxID=212818 RepID=A0A0D2AFH2_EXOME|nr:uncharacterized protein PV10_01367 [Exophiala mesophila]KIV97648.1 hypothetical protein PV10_01367 [Exophiala mesophila]